MWGINGKSCLMKLTNFSITSGLVQDPMHVFLDGILPKELSSLLFHLVFTQKLFTLKWLNGKIRSFNYSYLHMKNKPEETFEKGDVENCTHIKQSSSALHTLCQILPLILGPKVEMDNEHWINFLRLVQIVLLCLSSYCNRETASVLRILIGLYLRISRRLYPKASFVPKKHYMLHLPKQMLKYEPIKHHSCMRFEAKHGFFKAKKIRNFKNLPYSLSKHHQLYMCMKQSGTKGERSCNFLYDGDVVVNGKEINFSVEYPNLTIEIATVSQKNVQDEWPMYKTESVTIHG